MFFIILILIFWYLCIMLASGIISMIHRITLFNKYKMKFSFVNSYCDFCYKKIEPFWLANTPLFNYLYLSGKTNCCDTNISYLYPISEFSLGTLIFVLLCIWV